MAKSKRSSRPRGIMIREAQIRLEFPEGEERLRLWPKSPV